jgi:hypothetical protein
MAESLVVLKAVHLAVLLVVLWELSMAEKLAVLRVAQMVVPKAVKMAFQLAV